MIKYKGAIYRKAVQKHEKCPKGKHWNELSHSCQSLGAAFHRKHKEVKALQSAAEKATAKAERTKSQSHHSDAGVAHARAWNGLNKLHHHLQENGFQEAANSMQKDLKNHDSATVYHHQKGNTL